MRAVARVLKPGEIEFQLTFTATLDEWVKIRNTLKPGNEWPDYEPAQLVYAINEIFAQATKAFDYVPPDREEPNAG